MTNIDELAAKMRAAAGKATPGPWNHSSDNTITQTAHITRDVWFIPKVEADMSHIAAANPANVLAILGDRDRLKAQVAEARRFLVRLSTQGISDPAHREWLERTVPKDSQS